jgi:hypothetical protein
MSRIKVFSVLIKFAILDYSMFEVIVNLVEILVFIGLNSYQHYQ